jgi:hypothetical protein
MEGVCSKEQRRDLLLPGEKGVGSSAVRFLPSEDLRCLVVVRSGAVFSRWCAVEGLGGVGGLRAVAGEEGGDCLLCIDWGCSVLVVAIEA